MDSKNSTEEMHERISQDDSLIEEQKRELIESLAYPDQTIDYAAGQCIGVCPPPPLARPEFVAYINKEGYLKNASVTIKTIMANEKPYLEDEPFENIYGIVLHRTSGHSLEDAYDQAKKSREGTHFYIDKDGKIYQAASQ